MSAGRPRLGEAYIPRGVESSAPNARLLNSVFAEASAATTAVRHWRTNVV
jgi:hypothetical protein